MTAVEELARLGVATLHEAMGKHGLVDLPLLQIIPGSRAAGPARTALCGPLVPKQACMSTDSTS